jgi:hypothetical protein
MRLVMLLLLFMKVKDLPKFAGKTQKGTASTLDLRPQERRKAKNL